jgi:adenylate cyclase
LERVDRQMLDEFHKTGVKTPEREDLVVLGIDDESQLLDTLWPEEIEESVALKSMKQAWPWPRRVWAELLDRMFAAGAKMVFLDLTMKSPASDPEDDRLFREALKRHAGKVILGMNFESRVRGGEGWGMVTVTRPAGTILGAEDEGLVELGHLNFREDEGVLRDVLLRTTMNEMDIRGFLGDPDGAIGARRDALEQLRLELAEREADGEGVPSASLVMATKLGLKEDPKLGRTLRMRFGNVGAYPPISIHKVFVEDIWAQNFSGGEWFRDKVVLVGAVSQEMQDIHETPVGRMTGVQVHAHAVAALLAGERLKSSPWWWQWVGVLVGAMVAWGIVRWVRSAPLCLIALLVVSGVGVWGVYQAFQWLDVELEPLPLLLAVNLCGLAGLAEDVLVQSRETRKLRRFLARYTSPELVSEMMSDRAGLYTMLGGVERTVTVFFSDVRGFTSMAEGMSPKEVVGQLNEYLSGMVEQVIRHRGLVDKFIGDAVMALWGSTRAQQSVDHWKVDAREAVASALEMRRVLEILNQGWRERGLQELRIGMGIHQGSMVVGNIGSASPYEKMDLTVIGDSVNLASRLEGVTKEYGVDLVISSAVWELVKEDFLCRSADLVQVKGKALPVEVFTVIGPATTARPPGLSDYEQGMVKYREGKFEEAVESFYKAREAGLDDVLTSTYVARCEALITTQPKTWDGVFVMTKK